MDEDSFLLMLSSFCLASLYHIGASSFIHTKDNFCRDDRIDTVTRKWTSDDEAFTLFRTPIYQLLFVSVSCLERVGDVDELYNDDDADADKELLGAAAAGGEDDDCIQNSKQNQPQLYILTLPTYIGA